MMVTAAEVDNGCCGVDSRDGNGVGVVPGQDYVKGGLGNGVEMGGKVERVKKGKDQTQLL